jgi:hypothetical protein
VHEYDAFAMIITVTPARVASRSRCKRTHALAKANQPSLLELNAATKTALPAAA